MTREDARFYGLPALVFGPLFIAGGWLAAFTEVGFALILAGTAMLLAAPVLWHSAKVAVAALALIIIGWGWPFVVVS